MDDFRERLRAALRWHIEIYGYIDIDKPDEADQLTLELVQMDEKLRRPRHAVAAASEPPHEPEPH